MPGRAASGCGGPSALQRRVAPARDLTLSRRVLGSWPATCGSQGFGEFVPQIPCSLTLSAAQCYCSAWSLETRTGHHRPEGGDCWKDWLRLDRRERVPLPSTGNVCSILRESQCAEGVCAVLPGQFGAPAAALHPSTGPKESPTPSEGLQAGDMGCPGSRRSQRVREAGLGSDTWTPVSCGSPRCFGCAFS